MSEPARPSRIVRWEILKGLPGEGPVPHYFHSGRATPWSEGVVVRFWNQNGTEWVGNFHGFGHADVLLWSEANAVAVIAGGHFYLIEGDDPNLYFAFGPRCIVNGMMLDEHHQILVVVADCRAHAFDVRRRPLWTKGPGWCIIES